MNTKLVTIRNITFEEIQARANDLVGQPLPGDESVVVRRVVQFQILPYLDFKTDLYSYDLALLVEVEPEGRTWGFMDTEEVTMAPALNLANFIMWRGES